MKILLKKKKKEHQICIYNQPKGRGFIWWADNCYILFSDEASTDSLFSEEDGEQNTWTDVESMLPESPLKESLNDQPHKSKQGGINVKTHWQLYKFFYLTG